MAKYRIKNPEGKEFIVTAPEGATQEDVLAYAKTQFSGQAAPQGEATPDPASQFGEDIAGSRPVRFALGAAAPFAGALQLGANVGDKIAAEFGLEPSVGKVINEHISELERVKQRGMKEAGTEGYDVMGLLGNVLSPAGLSAGKAMTATSLPGKIGQGAVLGAGYGAVTPVVGAEGTDDFLKTKALQTAGGAVVGAAVPLALEPLKKLGTYLYHIVEPYMPGGTERIMKRVLEEAAGPRKPAIQAELARPQAVVLGSEPVAGEAATAAGSAEFSAVQKQLMALRPSEYAARAAKQEAARLAAIRSVGGSPAALKAAEEARAAEAAVKYGAIEKDLISVKPPEDVLKARIANKFMSRAEALRDEGRFATLASQQENLANNWAPVLGQPRVPARYAPHTEIVPEAQAAAQDAAKIARQRLLEKTFLEHQLDSLMAEVGAESPRLGTLLSRPSMKNALKTAYMGAQESGTYFPTSKEAPFSVANLQRMKQAMDDVLKDPASFGLKATEAKEIGNTRNLFVQWLSKRSPAWAEARNAYAAASKPIDQMKIGQFLESKLLAPLGTSERASVFANAVKEAPSTIKRATESAKYEDLSQILTPRQIQSVEGVTQDLARQSEFSQLASAGAQRGREILGDIEKRPGYVPTLHRAFMIGQAIMRRLEGHASRKVLEGLSEKMQDPQEIARLLRDAPPQVRQQLLQEAASLARNQGAIGAPSVMFAQEQ